MKIAKFNFTKLSVLLVCTGVLLTISCSKDNDGNKQDNEAQIEFKNDYFDVLEADFSDGALPTSNSENLQVIDIMGNSTVLAGGTNPITVKTSENATDVIVGVKGESGYYTLPTQSGNNMTSREAMAVFASIQMLLGEDIPDSFDLAFAAADDQGHVGEYKYLTVNLLDSGIGVLHVSLSWDQENDVDLHLIEPDGEEIYFGNRYSSTGGELDIDSNAACSIDGINNENIFYEDESEIDEGQYEVLVDLWSNCNIPDNTNYMVSAYYNGQLLQTSEGVNPTSATFTPDDESANSDPVSVMKFQLPNGATARGERPVRSEKLYKFNFKSETKTQRVLSPEKM